MNCRKCGSYRVFPMFSLKWLPFFECIDCGAVYSKNLDDDTLQLRTHLHPLTESVIVFPEDEVEKILGETKTQTRRYSDSYRVGCIYSVRTKVYERSFSENTYSPKAQSATEKFKPRRG